MADRLSKVNNEEYHYKEYYNRATAISLLLQMHS